MGQQIGQYVHRFAIAHSCLLWKQWKSRSSWYAEEMKRSISLGVPTAQAPLVLPVLGWMVVRAGKLSWLFSRLQLFLSLYHLLLLPSILLRSTECCLLCIAALLHVLVLKVAAMMLIGLGIISCLTTLKAKFVPQCVTRGKQTAWKAPKCGLDKKA